jgi:hypothetical protein
VACRRRMGGKHRLPSFYYCCRGRVALLQSVVRAGLECRFDGPRPKSFSGAQHIQGFLGHRLRRALGPSNGRCGPVIGWIGARILLGPSATRWEGGTHPAHLGRRGRGPVASAPHLKKKHPDRQNRKPASSLFCRPLSELLCLSITLLEQPFHSHISFHFYNLLV